MVLNIINHKVYVGQTSQYPNTRWIQHKSKLNKNKHSNLHLQSAYHKYGSEAFIFILLDSNIIESEIDVYESKLIEWFKAINLSYNIESGGNKLKHLSKETKLKLSIWNKNNPNPLSPVGKPLTQEAKDNLRIKHLGKKMSQEIKDKISLTKRNNITDDLRVKCSLGRKGKKAWNSGIQGCYKHTESDKIKIGEVASKYFHLISPEGEIFQGKNISEFARQFDLNIKGITRVVSGERPHYKKWMKVKETINEEL
jgi:group I intron endonuclease